MSTTAELLKTKRLIFLHLLGVKIEEPYPMVIDRLFEFLDFDDSRDVASRKKLGNWADMNTVEKYDKKGNVVCVLRYDNKGRRSSTILMGSRYKILLKELHPVLFDHPFSYGSYSLVEDILSPFILSILNKKGIDMEAVQFTTFGEES